MTLDDLNDTTQRHSIGFGFFEVHIHRHGSYGATKNIDRGHAQSPLKTRCDHIFGQSPGFFEVGSRDAYRDDGSIGGAELQNLRLFNTRGQLGADTGNRVLDIQCSLIDIPRINELHRDQRHIVLRGGFNAVNTLDGGKFFVQQTAQILTHIFSGGTGINGQNIDQRRGGIGEELHGQLHIGHGAKNSCCSRDGPDGMAIGYNRSSQTHGVTLRVSGTV